MRVKIKKLFTIYDPRDFTPNVINVIGEEGEVIESKYNLNGQEKTLYKVVLKDGEMLPFVEEHFLEYCEII